jgi:hypothetical protein
MSGEPGTESSMSEVDRLSVIGPWTLTVGEDGAATYVDGWRPANLDEPTRKVEVVPADQLAGAVKERDYLLAEIARMRYAMQDAGMWDDFCAAYAKRYPIDAGRGSSGDR